MNPLNGIQGKDAGWQAVTKRTTTMTSKVWRLERETIPLCFPWKYETFTDKDEKREWSVIFVFEIMTFLKKNIVHSQVVMQPEGRRQLKMHN